jgi:pilus assembly protein CpaB
MQKQRIILIVGAILAFAVAFLVKVYLDQQRQILQEEASRELAKKQQNQSTALVATQDIPKGALIKPEMLETKIFPLEYIVPQAVTSLDRIAGMIAVAPISKDEQITLSKLAYPRQAGSLAEATPVGKRAITISVDNIASLGGMIKPGDYVDLIAMISVPAQTADGKQVSQIASIPLSQNVLVLAVGQQTGAPPSKGGETSRYAVEEQESRQQKNELPSLITVALSPQEANFVAFVQEQAKIRLLLRSPADSQTQPFTLTNWDALFQYLMPPKKEAGKQEQKTELPKPKVEPKPKPIEYVEIYRGLKREKVPLSE